MEAIKLIFIISVVLSIFISNAQANRKFYFINHFMCIIEIIFFSEHLFDANEIDWTVFDDTNLKEDQMQNFSVVLCNKFCEISCTTNDPSNQPDGVIYKGGLCDVDFQCKCY